MDEDQVCVEYLSTGASRHTAIADWNADGLVAFGADSNIALWRPHDTSKNGISKLISGHTDTVKAVKFLPRLEGESTSYLISGSNDQSIRLWSIGRDGAPTSTQTAHEHSAPVNCIATLQKQGRPAAGPRLFSTGAADASVKLWTFDGTEARVLQTIKPSPKFFPLSLALSVLGEHGEALVLAVAGTKDIIQIFVSDSIKSPDFKLQATLSGHEGWIRSLDFTRESDQDGSDLILASASQDKYIRLWRFHQGKELPAAAADGADPSLGAFMPGKSPSNKAHRLRAAEKDFTVTFEALLLGHDDWIYSAKWHADTATGRRRLLSTSADNTLAIWEADQSSGIWLTTVRLGEISKEQGATTATGSTGGFWTGLWSPDGTSVTCLGRTGSWRVWDHSKERDEWVPRIGVSGHTRAVTGIAWSKTGEYLLSTSSDQTTRLHARWTTGSDSKSWHEMARPQIHGYDLNCVESLGSSQFVSGADEKLMRVFDEPKAVAKLLNRLSGIGDSHIDALPDAANMPVLGLSNKAIDAVDDDAEVTTTTAADPEKDRSAPDPATVVRKSALELDHPPLEDSLSRHTLWPEAEKLYGHGYEISCLAVSHDGRLIASACKASSVNHAVIRMFETERWTEVKPPLTAHSLTATRLRFSPADRYLLSVGRDRQWAVFERDEGEVSSSRYAPLQSNPKGHSRMILDATWAPTTTDALVFATAGRDKQVKIWRRGQEGKEQGGGGGSAIACVTTISETNPVTAVDFLPRPRKEDGHLVLAVGTEAGKISVHIVDPSTLAITTSLTLNPDLCIAKAVLQLAWRPGQPEGIQELAIAGEDGSLRIYSFTE